MKRHWLIVAAIVAAGIAGAVALGDRSTARENPRVPEPAAAQPPEAKAKTDPAEAELRKLGADYVKAFNAGDAKAIAAMWTADGEFVSAEGEVLRGREAIEKDLAEQFKERPKAVMEASVDSVRSLGKHTVIAEGVLKIHLPNDSEPGETAFSALFVREDDSWKIASVTESEYDPGLAVTPKDLDWLVGDWAAKGDGRELSLSYWWDEKKVFLHGKYALSKDGKVVASGTQVVAKNPGGGLRSWLFDHSGTFGDSLWIRDGKRWLISATGTLPDGTEITATNIFVPLGPDSFTWQSIERTADGVALNDQSPVKVTRVKK